MAYTASAACFKAKFFGNQVTILELNDVQEEVLEFVCRHAVTVKIVESGLPSEISKK